MDIENTIAANKTWHDDEGRMGMASAIRSAWLRFKQVDAFLSKATESIGIKSGSVSRIARQYLHNWLGDHSGIDDQKLDRICENSHKAEWENGGAGLDAAIHDSVRAAGLEKGNEELNSMLAHMAVPILLSMHDGKRVFCICDIGAGTGMTSKALLERIAVVMGVREGQAFTSRFLKLRLMEPSMQRLCVAYDTIKSAKVQPESFRLEKTSMSRYFQKISGGELDIVISNAALHHMPTADYLADVRRTLAADGVLVTGDWYHTAFSHPALIVPLLNARGCPEKNMAAYMHFFNINEGDMDRLNMRLSRSECQDNSVVLSFLSALADNMKKVPGADFHFLEATESFEERKRKMAVAGFESDMNELKQKHRGFVSLRSNIQRAYPNHDLANVIAVAKVPIVGSTRSIRGK